MATMDSVSGQGTATGTIQARIPGTQTASAYGTGIGSGSIQLNTTVPLGAFDDFGFSGVSEPDPAMSYVSLSTTGDSVERLGGWTRHHLIATPPADYPVSDGYAWRRAAYAAVGYKFTGMVADNWVYMDDVQLEPLAYEATAPTAFEMPRQIGTLVKPDRLNYCSNPSFEVDTTDWTILGNATLVRDTAVARDGLASGRITWNSLAPLIDNDYETGSVPSDVVGYGGVTPTVMSGGPGPGGHNSNKALGTVTDSAVNEQGLIHMAPLGTSIAANDLVKGGAWVKAPAGTGLHLSGRALQVGSSTLITSGPGGVAFTATGDWQYVETNTWTWASGAFRPGLQVRLQTAASGVSIQWDDVAITNVTAGTPVTLTSPDYEVGSVPTDATGYFGATLSVVTGPYVGAGYQSDKALSVTTTSTVASEGMVHRSPIATVIASPNFLQGSAWVKAPAGTRLYLSGQAMTPGTSTVLSSSLGTTAVTATGDWQRVNTQSWTWLSGDFRPGLVLRMADTGPLSAGVQILMDKPTIRFTGSDTSTQVYHTVKNLIPGRRYVASIWTHAGTGGAAHPLLDLGSSTGRHRQVCETDGAWERQYITFVATQSMTSVRLYYPEPQTATVTSWVDQILVEEGDYPRDYFDGGYGPDYLWESGGTAGKTRSYYYSQRVEKNAILQRLLAENTPVGIYAASPQYAVPFTS